MQLHGWLVGCTLLDAGQWHKSLKPVNDARQMQVVGLRPRAHCMFRDQPCYQQVRMCTACALPCPPFKLMGPTLAHMKERSKVLLCCPANPNSRLRFLAATIKNCMA
mmetsp:Transcript_21159/g.31919  ORF Transcript_21159/g.31919 Transcript_21159/m.31919 type:complete len:107 (+) Transcript_21159:93-413(+)